MIRDRAVGCALRLRQEFVGERATETQLPVRQAAILSLLGAAGVPMLETCGFSMAHRYRLEPLWSTLGVACFDARAALHALHACACASVEAAPDGVRLDLVSLRPDERTLLLDFWQAAELGARLGCTLHVKVIN